MGPLAGVKVIELAGIGPAPFCAMMLADMGAEVIRVDRAQGRPGGIGLETKYGVLQRSRKSIRVDLKSEGGIETIKRLVEGADALIEGFRPGVMERLGLGPDELLKRNPALIFGRMTGWGQEGPIAHTAGHDINYIALAGTLSAIGIKDGPPVPPLNLVGDFGGGGMLLAFGVLAGIIEARNSGKGQVIDAAMVDGSAILAASIHGMLAQGLWKEGRGGNILDTGAHFYDTYECADGEYVSIGSIEPQFYAELIELGGLDPDDFGSQMKRDQWPEKKEKLAKVMKTKTRDEWDAIMQQSDICFAPVLGFAEAHKHPHNVARDTFVEVEGVMQPAPAPRFSRTKEGVQMPPPKPGQHTDEVLGDWGFSESDIKSLHEQGAIKSQGE